MTPEKRRTDASTAAIATVFALGLLMIALRLLLPEFENYKDLEPVDDGAVTIGSVLAALGIATGAFALRGWWQRRASAGRRQQ